MRLILVHAAHEVMQIKFTGVFEPCRLGQFQQGVQGVVVKITHPLGFGLHDQRHLSFGVLGCNTRWAIAGVAGLSLNAPNGEHEAPGAVAPISAQSQGSCHVKSGDDFAAGTQFNFVSQIQAHQGVVNKS